MTDRGVHHARSRLTQTVPRKVCPVPSRIQSQAKLQIARIKVKRKAGHSWFWASTCVFPWFPFSFLTNFSNPHLAFQKQFSLNLANPILESVPILFMNKSNKGNEATSEHPKETLLWKNCGGTNARCAIKDVCKMPNHKRTSDAQKIGRQWNFLPACR
jgi:hypothetical protein